MPCRGNGACPSTRHSPENVHLHAETLVGEHNLRAFLDVYGKEAFLESTKDKQLLQEAACLAILVVDKLVPRELRHRLDIGVAVGETGVEVVVDFLKLWAYYIRPYQGDKDRAVVMHISCDIVQDLLRQSEFPAVLHDHLPTVLLMEAVIDCHRPPRVIIGDKHLVKNHVVVELDGKHILVPVDVEGQASFPS